MSRAAGASAQRTVLIGLDGATFSVLDGLMADGTMPFLASFADRGVRATLRSTPHALTPPAWTSLATGRGPGEHGIFDFVKVDATGTPPGYALVSSGDVRCETIWSMASRHGRRVAVLNFPCTFPPPPIDGFVVPGFVPWSYLPRATHPRDLYARLKSHPGFVARELAIDWSVERKALQGLPESDHADWIAFHTARERQWFEIATLLMREEPCELTAILFDGVDKLQHLCYHLLDARTEVAPDSARTREARERCLDYFRQLDRFLEEIVTLAGPEARVFVASDHGFAAAGDEIYYVNTWLEQHGYLAWGDGVGNDGEGHLTLESFTETGTLFDWSRTTAFAPTASGNAIYIRRADPGGAGVPAAELDGFRDALRRELLGWSSPTTGRPVIERLLTREEAFPGPASAQAPDLTLIFHDHSFLSVLRADSSERRRTAPYGTHHPDGVFIAAGAGLREGEALPAKSILGMTPTLLYSLDLPIGADLPEEPFLGAFTDPFRERRPVRREEPIAPAPSAPAGQRRIAPHSDDVERQIVAQLKALGYLE